MTKSADPGPVKVPDPRTGDDGGYSVAGLTKV
jgi:hypothetical protein